MSDLEATSSRGQSAAQITTIATGKLRTVSGNGRAFAKADGLADAFAEVFARIAASASQPTDSRVPNARTESSQVDIDDPSAHADENASDQSESPGTAAETYVEVEPQVAETFDAGQVEKTDLDEELDTLAVEQDDQGVTENEVIDVALFDVSQANVDDEEIETPVVIVQEVLADEPEHLRQARRDSTTFQPAVKTEGERQHPNRTTNEKPISRNSERIAENDEQSLEPTDQNDRKKSPRHLRRRHGRNRETIDPNPKPVSQASRDRAAKAVTTAAASGEATASLTGQSPDSASRPVTRSAESGVVSAQSIAAKVQQSGTATTTHPGTRGSTQGVESTASMRPTARTKLDSPSTKSSAAETVTRIKLIQRVSKAFQHLGPEGGVVRLRLAPAEMGSVRVEMRINQRNVQARVVAETEAASKALREHLPDLRVRLESFGMQVEKIEIATETNDSHQGSQLDAESHQQDDQRQSDDWPGRRTPGAKEPVSPQVPQSAPVYQIDTVSNGVDVRL